MELAARDHVTVQVREPLLDLHCRAVALQHPVFLAFRSTRTAPKSFGDAGRVMNQPLPPPAAADAACAVRAALRSPKSKPDIATPKMNETKPTTSSEKSRRERAVGTRDILI